MIIAKLDVAKLILGQLTELFIFLVRVFSLSRTKSEISISSANLKSHETGFNSENHRALRALL